MLSERHKWLLQPIITFLSGSLATAAVTYLLAHKGATVLTRAITTTTISSSYPNMKIFLGGNAIPALNTHVVQIGMLKGPYLADINIALQFAKPVTLLEPITTGAPTASHAIACTQLPPTPTVITAIHCSMGSFDRGQEPFTITLLTDSNAQPIVSTAADRDKVRFQSPRDTVPGLVNTSLAVIMGIIFFLIALAIALVYLRLRNRSASLTSSESPATVP